MLASNNIHDLTGVGEEWLLDARGWPIAKFYDGMIVRGGVMPKGNREETILCE